MEGGEAKERAEKNRKKTIKVKNTATPLKLYSMDEFISSFNKS
jgi:hypothetical protein